MIGGNIEGLSEVNNRLRARKQGCDLAPEDISDEFLSEENGGEGEGSRATHNYGRSFNSPHIPKSTTGRRFDCAGKISGDVGDGKRYGLCTSSGRNRGITTSISPSGIWTTSE